MVARSLQAALWHTVGFVEPPREAVLILRIVLRGEQLNVRQLAAYLAFGDRVYGRVKFGSLQRYARREGDQLTIARTQTGSLILVIKEVLDGVASPHGIILTALVLKYLPEVIRAPASAYKDYEGGRLRRAERKRLEAITSADDSLKTLERKQLRLLTKLLSKIYELESHRLAALQNFAIRSVLDVEIEAETSKPDESGSLADDESGDING